METEKLVLRISRYCCLIGPGNFDKLYLSFDSKFQRFALEEIKSRTKFSIVANAYASFKLDRVTLINFRYEKRTQGRTVLYQNTFNCDWFGHDLARSLVCA